MEVTLSQFAQDVFAAEAAMLETQSQTLVRDALEAEAKRLWYIQRSRKPKKAKELAPEESAARAKEVRKLGRTLLAVYDKIKLTRWSDELERQMAEIVKAIKSNDLGVLSKIKEAQPWTTRR